MATFVNLEHANIIDVTTAVMFRCCDNGLFAISAFASAGMADYLHTNKKIVSIWLMFTLNVPLGMVIGATLDAIRITSPRLIKQLVNKLGDSAVSIIGDAIIDKLNALLRKRVVLKDDVDGITDSNSHIDKN